MQHSLDSGIDFRTHGLPTKHSNIASRARPIPVVPYRHLIQERLPMLRSRGVRACEVESARS
ncbi:MAG: hypothetical protein R2856_23450 [Caldilineaceae bacterium]